MAVKGQSLPLGIDIGATRIRIVHAVQHAGIPAIAGVAVRDCDGGPTSDAARVATLIEDMVAELGTREKRCVVAVGEPDARVHVSQCPAMTTLERESWARYEAARHAGFPLEQATIRVRSTGDDRWAIGIVRTAALAQRTAPVRAAKLKVVCVDHEALAVFRALHGFGAVIDIGHSRSVVHVLDDGEGPRTLHVPCGGADITQAIAQDLDVDVTTAERRKRILGTAGAGERARTALVCDIAQLLHRAQRLRPLERCALIGNGARLCGLAADIVSQSGIAVDVAVSATLQRTVYPPDVVRAGAMDWTLATGLALWAAA